MKKCLPRDHPGFSLLELLASISVIAVLAVLILFSFDGIKNRIEAANCINNLRNLHVALAAQLADTKKWPQVPEDLDDDGYAKFWRQTLAPYGVDAKVWRCPTAARTLNRRPEDELVDIDYTPAEFDELESTPFKHPTQPWVIEAGDFHGDGNLMILTSGETVSFNKFYKRQTGSNPPWSK